MRQQQDTTRAYPGQVIHSTSNFSSHQICTAGSTGTGSQEKLIRTYSPRRTHPGWTRPRRTRPQEGTPPGRRTHRRTCMHWEDMSSDIVSESRQKFRRLIQQRESAPFAIEHTRKAQPDEDCPSWPGNPTGLARPLSRDSRILVSPRTLAKSLPLISLNNVPVTLDGCTRMRRNFRSRSPSFHSRRSGRGLSAA